MTVIVEFIGAEGGIGVDIIPGGTIHLTPNGGVQVRLASGALKTGIPGSRLLRASYVPDPA